MSASIINFRHDSLQRSACEALADKIISGIPAQAEAHGLPTGRVVQAVWLALFCDLVDPESDSADAGDLFELARRAARASVGEPL